MFHFVVAVIVEEPTSSSNRRKMVEKDIVLNVSLEGNIVPFEDVEKRDEEVITIALVGEVISSKVLNKRTVKDILVKA